MANTWPSLLEQLMSGEDLSADDAAWAMERILSGEATDAQIAAFAVAVRSKGETVGEVRAFVDTILTHATPLELGSQAVVDVVGTGGDRSGSVNISTMAAIVTAAAGVPVVKHGNRAASSQSGSADVLEALGLPLDLAPERVAALLSEVGITFCFAPVFHPAMRFAGPPRRQMGIPTIFNLLGPLANPARPTAMAVGIADPARAPLVAGVLADEGVSALVVRGDDGLDELTTTTTSRIWRVQGGEVRTERLDPADLDVAPVEPDLLKGGDAAANAEVVHRLVAGETGPVRDVVLLNAAAALVAFEGEGSADLTTAIAQQMERAAQAIDSGAAQTLLTTWIARAR